MRLLAEGGWGGWMYFQSMPTALMVYEQRPLSTHVPVWTINSKVTIAEASQEAEDKDSDPFPFEDVFS